MKKQFNLRDWLKDKSQKIETRNGLPAHYIGLDRAGWQVLEIFRANGTSEYKTYHDSYLYSGPGESTYDLFLVTPEPELSEFEKKLSDVFGYAISMSVSDPKKPTDEFVREYAPELLSLACEQFIKDGYVIEKKAFHDAVENISDKHLAEMSVQYSIHCKVEDGTRHAIMNWDTFQKVAQKFIDIGKEEALKDLPRWREWDNGAAGNSEGHPIALVSGTGGIRFVSVLGVTGEKYIMLDDLKKLPGFKED